MLNPGVYQMGHTLILSDDETAMAYLGRDTSSFLLPVVVTLEAHHIDNGNNDPGRSPGYLNRIARMINCYEG